MWMSPLLVVDFVAVGGEGVLCHCVGVIFSCPPVVHLLEVLPEAKLFPVLDLLRLTFISSESVDYFLSSHGG